MSPLARFENADWSAVPARFHHEIERWLVDGIVPASPFIGDVLTGDLRRACSRVPERDHLFQITDFLALHAPLEAWGNGFNCEHWARLGGLRGIAATDTARAYETEDDRKRGPVRLWRRGRSEEDDE